MAAPLPGLSRKYPDGPAVLTNRMRRMASLLVFGHPDDETRTRYSLADAARAVGYRAKAGRSLWNTSRLFRDEVERLVAERIRGRAADNVDIPDDPAELLQLLSAEAANRIGTAPSHPPGYVIDLSEDPPAGRAPGYVIRLPAGVEPPKEAE